MKVRMDQTEKYRKMVYGILVPETVLIYAVTAAAAEKAAVTQDVEIAATAAAAELF
jgi:hypothetical protein